jgi:histidyl-tRNA synthetase
MALSTQPYKGARDFYPGDKRLQKFMFTKIRHAVERFGYEEYDAPILEPLELYLAKTGEEIVNEQTYAFSDRGGRQVVVRPEMTPTVSRMVAARRQELAYPLRWYSIPNLWRYERPQRGRFREHWQLNVDIFGVADTKAELEVIQVAEAVFKAFKAKRDMYEIRINSRQLMDYVLAEYLGLDEIEAQSIAKLIDRMNKMDASAFIAQVDAICSPSKREAGVTEKLMEVLSAKTVTGLPPALQTNAALERVVQLLRQLSDLGITNARFDASLMRGFDYYTDIIFEIFDTHPENNRAMLGGGRYDGLVALFGVEPLPTVGFGLGDATLQNFLEIHNLLPPLDTETDLYVVLIGDILDKALPAIDSLREMGLNVAVDFSARKVKDQFRTAEKKAIHYVLIIGEDELVDEQFTLKHLQTGTEEKHGLQRIVSIVKDYRNHKYDSN